MPMAQAIFSMNHIFYALLRQIQKVVEKQVIKITVTVREWLNWGYDKKRCHAIYRQAVQSFNTQSATLPIDPYIFGVWLGDGRANATEIYNPDPEIITAWSDYIASLGLIERKRIASTSKTGEHCYAIYGTKDGGNTNPFKEKLRELDLVDNKHIPHIYLTASVEDRQQLLAGLIDTVWYRDWETDRKSTRLNSSHSAKSRMPSSA